MREKGAMVAPQLQTRISLLNTGKLPVFLLSIALWITGVCKENCDMIHCYYMKNIVHNLNAQGGTGLFCYLVASENFGLMDDPDLKLWPEP